jgi:hypothetical protein
MIQGRVRPPLPFEWEPAMEVISLGVAVTALIAASTAAFWAGRLDGRLSNGLTESIVDIRKHIAAISKRFNELPCGSHTEQLKQIDETLERLRDN